MCGPPWKRLRPLSFKSDMLLRGSFDSLRGVKRRPGSKQIIISTFRKPDFEFYIGYKIK